VLIPRGLSPILLALAACGTDHAPRLKWGLGVKTFDAVALGIGSTEPAAPWIAALPFAPQLVVPTYDGSDQVVHPDILAEPDRITLAITPYPYSNGDFENPSLFSTTDGVHFDPLAGAPAPLVPTPAYDHNDDPDLRIDPVTGEHELLYLETLRPDTQTVVALRSRDLVTWTRTDAIVYDFSKFDDFLVSPAAIVADDGTTHMFYVELVPGRPVPDANPPATVDIIQELVSADGRTWDKAAKHPIQVDLGAVNPWHLDAIRGPNGFAILLSGFVDDFGRQDLFLLTSPDLVTWTMRPEPLLSHLDSSLAVYSLYRSTGIVSGNTLAVWYSMQYWE
jgi:hypothetical protein